MNIKSIEIKQVYILIFCCAFLIVSCKKKEKLVKIGVLEYTFIPNGEFIMGCIPGDTLCWEEELPRRKIRIDQGYWMTTTEVTVGSFRKFISECDYIPESELKNKGRIFQNEINDWVWTPGTTWENPLIPGYPVPNNFPVSQVSWSDANNYCLCHGGRLPTEVEWEYAARGGQENQLFTWGNEWTPILKGIPLANTPDSTTKALYSNMSVFNNYNDGFATYAPVGSFPPNDFLLYDMSGNVWDGV